MSFYGWAMQKFFPFFCARSDRRRDEGLTEPTDIRAFRSLRYAEGGDEGILDIYLPAEEREKYPVIVSAHGGGFCYGDKELYRFYCMDFARRGFAVINFNYRLLPARYPAPLEDFAAVMQFSLTHAREYSLNTKNFFAVGDSAGALMVEMYAAALSNADYAALLPVRPPRLRFNAVALHSSPFAGEKAFQGSMNLLKPWLGKNRREIESNWEIVRLYKYADGFPPAFLTYSVNDSVAEDTPRFAGALRSSGTPCECLAYGEGNKKVGHVFHLDIRSSESRDCTDRQILFFNRYLKP